MRLLRKIRVDFPEPAMLEPVRVIGGVEQAIGALIHEQCLPLQNGLPVMRHTDKEAPQAP